ncbi:ATP-binding protein [Butyrivibrio fibrisolvens]|uniref:AAA family ATPase n=1 Tax=Pseudobutyrivibrio ruminis TaxID=46206 RepID=UPI000415E098|nr:ATP-binding protein [Pseudobutyrivibrio ruminis]MDC7278786.1 ATP-binding protein [Butyrivibrio fibrisolvens]
MLIQFSVKNFMSFKEKAILALNPSVDKEHPENINENNGYEAANTIAIYGANASGKTSLFKAMTVAVNMLKNSNFMQVNQPIGLMMPFKFDDNINNPSEFEFIFVADDGNRYIYGFSADRKRIHEEYLYQYKSKKPTMIFERHGEEYEFKSQKNVLEPLVRFNTQNKLFLATATNWNTESTTIPYKWLSEKIVTFTDAQVLTDLSLNLYKSSKKEEYLSFTEDLLHAADINISKLKINVKKTKMPLGMLTPQLLVNGQQIPTVTAQEMEQIEVTTEHVIGEGDNKNTYSLGLLEESLGTNQLFLLGPVLKDVFENGTSLFIDEIDNSLHTFIVKHIINMFRNPDINKSGAQLIFTTHDTSLLSLSTFRRDQVYFTEKNNTTGASDLYSLDEFSVRKTDNIEKGYLLGRYGAIPYIRGEEL